MLRASSRTKFAARTRFPSSLRSSSSFQTAPPTSSPPPRERRQPPSPGRYTVAIRTWDRLRSPVDSLAIIQYLEQSFGRVQEFRNLKNGEFLTDTLYVRFQDAESAKRALSHTTVISIPSPRKPQDEGGISLADCETYLGNQPVDRNITANGPDNTDVMFRIRTAHELATFRPSGVPRTFLPRRSQVAFAQWAGFAPIAPILKGTSLEGTDHPRMRAIVRRFEERANAPNPLEYSPKETEKSTHSGESTHQDLSEIVQAPETSHSSPPSPIEAVSEEEPRDASDLSPLPDASSTSDPEITIDSVIAEPVVEATEHPSGLLETVQEATTQPTDTKPSAIGTPPPPSPRESAARKAIETAQVHQAARLLQKFQGKPKRTTPTHPNPPKIARTPKHSQPFLEVQKPEETDASAQVTEAAQSHPESVDQKTESEPERQGRLKKFIGGWF
ncbi:hypothetical protein PQX77_002566 [Marasmius sp. AFHP31]|nr:hypothetical protein PQX77_002566 [Marasmius sp. AFHP31]